MNITEVKVFPVSEEKLKAFVSVVIDDCFMINDIKIIQGRESRFISIPSRRKKSGDFKDVAHPLNNETRRMIEDRILAEYDRVLAGREEEPAAEGTREGRQPEAQSAETSPGEPSSGAPPGTETPGGEVSQGEGGAEGAAGKTLEEVAEKHLSDSFWNT